MAFAISGNAQTAKPLGYGNNIKVRLNPQCCFPKTIPAGNYSGIAWLGGNQYAVVSDKAVEEGFFVFEINTDSTTGKILSARNLGFRSSHQPARDNEGIAYNPHTKTVFITGETNNVIREFNMEGLPTGRSIAPTPFFSQLPGNLGLEALSYDAVNHKFWTCNESGMTNSIAAHEGNAGGNATKEGNTIIIQSYNDSLQPVDAYRYALDAPVADRSKAQYYAHGVGTLTALADGSLLLLERELYVPHKKLGAFVNCKLYHFSPQSDAKGSNKGNGDESDKSTSNIGSGSKTLLARWKTKLTITGRSFANYEGMCLGPRLKDGSRVMLLVADSQNQYRGVLKDWIKSLRITLPDR